MTLQGTVINGSIVLDQPQSLPEGAKVWVEVIAAKTLLEPRDDWERRVRGIARDCGVSLSNEVVSSEALYD